MMQKTGEQNHLKLVYDQARDERANFKKVERETQLSFSFFYAPKIVLLTENSTDQTDFFDLIYKIQPKWIFDIRIAPRFDSIAGSRANAFKLFCDVQSEYVDIFGELNIKNYHTAEANPAHWVVSITNLLRKKSDHYHKPLMFIFETKDMLKAAFDIIPPSLKNAGFASAESNTIIYNGNYIFHHQNP